MPWPLPLLEKAAEQHPLQLQRVPPRHQKPNLLLLALPGQRPLPEDAHLHAHRRAMPPLQRPFRSLNSQPDPPLQEHLLGLLVQPEWAPLVG